MRQNKRIFVAVLNEKSRHKIVSSLFFTKKVKLRPKTGQQLENLGADS